MTKSERRREIRAPARLAMEVKLSGRDYERVESINVSANGVYFSSPQHIAPLTKLGITLILPENTDGTSGEGHEVFCEGVVVRVDPETPSDNQDDYEIACFFTSISEKDKGFLESYILHQLAF
ncbi:MAG: PilZ domain-containing protein [Candidatus Krumholzibacteria bacterium]